MENSTLIKYPLGWGNSVAVRDAFLATYHQNPMVFAKEELAKFDYPTHEGDPGLVEITKKVILRQAGQSYKHVFLTNGATGGVVISLRAYAQRGKKYCLTRQAPYYVRYPRMIDASGLEQVEEGHSWSIGSVVGLLDLPSNPLGLQTNLQGQYVSTIPLIIDGVYLSRVYMPIIQSLPNHDVMVGSYSKLLGINGIRVGWIATNDDMLAERLRELVASEYCGLSSASTLILEHTLQEFNWDRFEDGAKYRLDANRDEWTKLEKFFGDTPTPSIGMFYYGPMDHKAQQIFLKAGVSWTPGSMLGTDDSFARFNIGQGNDVIQNAVKAVLKADRIK